jgi:hypothetical protein
MLWCGDGSTCLRTRIAIGRLCKEIEVALRIPHRQQLLARMTERWLTKMRDVIEIGCTLAKVAGTPMALIRQFGIAGSQNLMAQGRKCFARPLLLEGRERDGGTVTARSYHTPHLFFIDTPTGKAGARYERVRPCCGRWGLSFSHTRTRSLPRSLSGTPKGPGQ